ncbi:hypothetical protein EOL94_02750 [bacterium]|nr:hypothetical protein [bacterium]
MKKTTILLILIALSLLLSLSIKAQKIKYANYWLLPTIENVEDLSRYDMVIVDKENILNNKDSLYLLKEKNPNVILLLYLNPIEIFSEKYLIKYGDKPFTTMIYKYLSATNKWWLKNTDGEIAYFDPRQQMLNMSSSSEKIHVSYYKKDMQYWEFIAQMQLDILLKDTILDGIFEDNFETFEWIGDKSIEKDAYKRTGNKKFDIDGDGKADSRDKFRIKWEEGMELRLKKILKEHPDFIVIGNKGKVFLPEYCNNKMFENWPNIHLADRGTKATAYNKNMQNLLLLDSLSIINPDDENYFWLAFASAMLIDKPVFLSINQNDKWKDSLYIDYRLWGNAIDSAETKFVSKKYYRRFENGYFKIHLDTKGEKQHKIIFEIFLKESENNKGIDIKKTLIDEV